MSTCYSFDQPLPPQCIVSLSLHIAWELLQTNQTNGRKVNIAMHWGLGIQPANTGSEPLQSLLVQVFCMVDPTPMHCYLESVGQSQVKRTQAPKSKSELSNKSCSLRGLQAYTRVLQPPDLTESKVTSKHQTSRTQRASNSKPEPRHCLSVCVQHPWE